jgi:hypothetical protein
MDNERILMPKRFSTRGVSFEVNPLQDFLIKRQIATNEVFARAYHTDMTKVFYETFDYKVKNRENIATGCKGATRSGKSMAAASLNWQTATLYEKYNGGDQHDYFNVDNVCANESEYAYKVKAAKFGWTYQVDEQRESKFQMGSVREELYIMDVQNIIAKQCINNTWLFPTDFIERNCQLGLETIGRDNKVRMTKCMVYDLSKAKLGFGFTPLGYVVIPIRHLWTCEETEKYSNCDICPKFATCDKFIAQYERKKNFWIQQEKEQTTGELQKQRFKMGEMLAKSKMFAEAPNAKQRKIIARNVFPQLTEGELGEVMEIAKMGITFDQMQKRLESEHRKPKERIATKKILRKRPAK